MVMPTLTHIALQVPDLDSMIDFYSRYCGMTVVHSREGTRDGASRVVWIAEPAKQHEMIFVLLSGGSLREPPEDDYSHFGFAVHSRDAVDRVADLAREEGRLVWPPREEPYPVGYYCGVIDPAGHRVEFSYGQPLGPGSPQT